ncbi:hypothetical protein [Fimbriimonas ginsengisoli]|uniref:hypothetical protein n=1 Tax=Fimbriimonas ginsengisoli TaxID=1005039 RepID=UPI000698E0CA|nr:hypothetical protein [Fimbriimonas ginsengisoli]
MARKWPRDENDVVVFAQDLDLLGRKHQALEIIENVVRRHKTKDDTGNRAQALLAYLKKGGSTSV